MNTPASRASRALPAPGPIVVALDGSRLAEQTLPLAAELARRTGARLHLVTAHQAVTSLPGDAFDASYDPAWLAATEAGQKAYLATIAEGLAKSGIQVASEVPAGPAAQALLDHVDREGAALLVMSTHGRGGLNRLWLGSTLDRVMRKAVVPLLVVRSSEEERTGVPALRKIVIPLDGSTLAEAAIEPAVFLGAAFGAEYEIVRVVPPVVMIGSPYMAHAVHTATDLLEADRAAAERYLDAVKERVELEHGVTVRTRVVAGPGEPVADAILAAAREAGADLIAVATHGRGGLPRVALGSIADKLIRAATLPLLIVRPDRD